MTFKALAVFHHHRRAVAAVEFALTAPLLMIALAGATDYGYREWSRSCLANAVAQGAYYAFLTGPTVSGTAVQLMVQKASSLSGVAIRRVPTVACYCPSGSPAALGTPVGSCTAACPDGTTPGTYLAISATYTLTPFIPSYSGLSGATITEAVTVRLQ
jgi:Flp pilus assembly protein TadG